MDFFSSLDEDSIARNGSTGLDDALRALTDDLRLVVDSYLGLTLTLRHEGFPVTFTVLEDSCRAGDIRASLRLPSSALAEVEIGSVLDLYAATPGAFVDLAADVCHALQLPPERVVLDHHLTPPANASALTGARGLSQINQAVGILVSYGQTPEDARIELRRRAHHNQSSMPCVALELIRATVSGSARAMD